MHNNTYVRLESVINYDTLEESYALCSNGLRWKDSIIRYGLLHDLYVNDIINQFYYENRYTRDPLFHTYIHERGKQRLICSTTVRDRVVDKCFNRHFLLPSFVPKFIYDNGASLPGKGLDFSLDRFEHIIRQAIMMYGGTDFYFLKCDIKSYFDNIPHGYLLDQIQKCTKDPRIINFYIDHFTMLMFDEYIHGGLQVPYGLGLGSEQNQTFGLLCLNEMDHMIKEKYKIKGYTRYMDDFVLIHKDKKVLGEIKKELEEYLKNRLNLEFNQNKTNIISAKQGILYLKVHFYPNEKGYVVRKVYQPTVKKFKRKLKKLSDLYKEGLVSFTDLRAFFASSKGTLIRCNDIRQIQVVDDLFNQLFIFNWIDESEYNYYLDNKNNDEIVDDAYNLYINTFLAEGNTVIEKKQ